MQIIRQIAPEDVAQVGWNLQAVVVAPGEGASLAADRLAGLGLRVLRMGDIYSALSAIMDDPSICNMLVVECDQVGGLDDMRRTVRLMGETMALVPVILISSECQTQSFSQIRTEPTVLRAPLSAVSLRVGFEHVMRDRLVPRVA